MRALFLAHRLPYPPDKGDKIRSFHELEAMAKHHEVDLFCFYDQPLDRRYFSNVRRYCRKFYTEKISWLRSRAQAAFACASKQPFTTAFFYSPTMARRIREAVSQRSYDLVFVFGSCMARYAECASHLPRILDMVDVDSDKWTQYSFYSSPPASCIWSAEAKRLLEYEKECARAFSTTLLCTYAEAEILKEKAPDGTIEVFENCMDLSQFDPSRVAVPSEIAACQPYIVFTGSMDYFPNVDAVTTFCREVLPLIRSRLPMARFVIAGRNPVSAVRKLARDPAVVVTGAVTDIRPYLRGASAAVAPLRVARGIQTKIFEAMAMELPVGISSKAARSLPASLVARVHVEDDPRRLAEFLIKVLEAPAKHVEARRAVLEYARHQEWEKQWENLLFRVIQGHGREIERAGNIEASSVRHGHISLPSYTAAEAMADFDGNRN